MRIWKKIMATALSAALIAGMSMSADAKNWIDGNTPEELNNRVSTSTDEVFTPSVVTDFHASDIPALVPVSPKSLFDKMTGVDVSHYTDACTHVYVDNNGEYGPECKKALNNALYAVGAKNGATITLNLLKYEGGVYKSVAVTEQELEFKMQIPKSLRASTRDFAIIRVNADGTTSYLTDLDTDSKTVTFRTNYFDGYNVYCLAYGGTGCFDAYKPQVTQDAALPTGNVVYVVINGQYVAAKYAYDANGQIVLVPVQ